MSKTKLGIYTLLLLGGLVAVARLINGPSSYSSSLTESFQHSFNFKEGKKWVFEFSKPESPLKKIVEGDLNGAEGTFAVYIEELGVTLNQDQVVYGYNEKESFLSASLYKLVLMAAAYELINDNKLSLDDTLVASKAHLASVYGGIDYGYEEAPATIYYTVEEVLTRIGRISDNFASIMLSEKIKTLRDEPDTFTKTALRLGMVNTNFSSDGVTTTAADVGLYFKKLYLGEVVSKDASASIEDFLLLSQLNNRIPAKLSNNLKIVHKTGEMAGLRHDAGIIYLNSVDVEKEATGEGKIKERAYIIVMLSKDLKDEEEGIEALANLSKSVYDFFQSRELR